MHNAGFINQCHAGSAWQIHHVSRAEPEVEAHTLAEADRVPDVEAEVSVIEATSMSEPGPEAAEELLVEALTTHQASAGAEPAAESAGESVETEMCEPKQVTEAAAAEEEEGKVLAKEEVPEVPAEPAEVPH